MTDTAHTVLLDVALHPSLHAPRSRQIVVYVAPLDDGCSVLAQLEDASELELDGEALPVADLVAAIGDVRSSNESDTDPLIELVALLPNARPACARIAREIQAAEDIEAVEFVCIPTDGRVSARAIYVAGVLLRVALEEIDAPTRLSEAAGVAVTVASSQGLPMQALAPTSGGSSEWLTYAASIDHVGAVPVLAPNTLRITH